jgi:hypothetical protein
MTHSHDAPLQLPWGLQSQARSPHRHNPLTYHILSILGPLPYLLCICGCLTALIQLETFQNAGASAMLQNKSEP